MSNDTKTNVPGSEPTSSAEAAKRSDPRDKDYDRAFDPKVDDRALTDVEYLRRQAARAKLAIGRAALGAKDAAVSGFATGKSSAEIAATAAAGAYNPMHLVEKRPWTTVAVSAVAGFVGVFWWNPNRYGRVKKRLDKLEKLFREHDKRVVEVKAVAPDGKKAAAGAAAGIGAVILQQALNVLKPLAMEHLGPLMSGLSEKLHAAQPQSSNGQSQSVDPTEEVAIPTPT